MVRVVGAEVLGGDVVAGRQCKIGAVEVEIVEGDDGAISIVDRSVDDADVLGGEGEDPVELVGPDGEEVDGDEDGETEEHGEEDGLHEFEEAGALHGFRRAMKLVARSGIVGGTTFDSCGVGGWKIAKFDILGAVDERILIGNRVGALGWV
ncbi:hypothetical protein EYC84_002953 [Monilinia fructicola]|uniref:Uncharacterized protein n=1 Tax=Monilinia fructicola TaxID=38448 RepID=A0A5M9JW41_MONFR|nr:hypothetical protein EYC84_002953 [Monilinia fructicola]